MHIVRAGRAAVAVALAATVFGTTACYHAVIETGKPASSETIKQPWAMSFVAGLVPPPVMETASKCPNGVARVETQHSFLNMLVTWVTFNIVSPMTIEVTCASGATGMVTPQDGKVVDVPAGSSRADLERTLNQAVETARQDDAPVYVSFEGVR